MEIKKNRVLNNNDLLGHDVCVCVYLTCVIICYRYVYCIISIMTTIAVYSSADRLYVPIILLYKDVFVILTIIIICAYHADSNITVLYLYIVPDYLVIVIIYIHRRGRIIWSFRAILHDGVYDIIARYPTYILHQWRT